MFEQMKKEVLKEVEKADNLNDLNEIRIKYLGKKGTVSNLMNQMRDLSNDEKPKFGAYVNQLKTEIEDLLNNKQNLLAKKQLDKALNKETIDVTMPGVNYCVGTIHPLMQTIEEIEDLFIGMGYAIAEGPEIESDEFNFEKLNLPKNHPARDMQDTFYINQTTLLRTHTSPVQARTMLESNGKPLKIICPGKVYRRDDDDATHSHQFMQIEGLVLGNNITFGDLKGTLLMMAKSLFGENKEIRVRPSYFPFTEPSVEVDVTCFKCGGSGCPLCKKSGWIEILGAGMVNKNVLEMCGYNSEVIQGFAFGVGVERITMLKYGIDDIRHFYNNDLRFLKQFKAVK